MRLLNKSLVGLSLALLLIISAWGTVFYFNMLNEIKESIDEGLEHYARQIISSAANDSTILQREDFGVGFFAIQEVNSPSALPATDIHSDTLMYMQDADDEAPELEPVRMLTTSFQKDGKSYILKVINSMVEEDDLIEELVYETLWLYLLLLLSIILINNFFLRYLWNPFYSFLDQLKHFRIGSYDPLPHVNTHTREFKDLQAAVNILLTENNRVYAQQKEFIGNASHELQTPLAVLMSKLELLTEKGKLTAEQAETIGESLEVIERLIRLNRSLLLLSRIESHHFINNQPVSVSQIVSRSVEEMSEIADFREVSLEIKDEGQVVADMDPSLAEIIVSNLLRNAIFHNQSGGSVTIVVGHHRLSFRNTGAPNALNPEEAFARFQKKDSTGNGLGLAIVKAICDLYHIQISYDFDHNQHVFSLDFSKTR